MDIKQSLFEIHEGYVLPQPHGQLLKEGKKTLIVDSKLYKDLPGKIMYVIEGEQALGIVKFDLPDKITVKEFNETKSQHLMTDDDRKKWWANKEVLYSYGFTVLEMFEKPMKVKLPRSNERFVNFDIENDESNSFPWMAFEPARRLIQDVANYYPEKLPDKVLLEDWTVCVAWYTALRHKKPLPYSEAQVIGLGIKIFEEMEKRGMILNPERQSPGGQTFLEIVTETVKNPSGLNQFQNKDEKENKEVNKKDVGPIVAPIQKGISGPVVTATRPDGTTDPDGTTFSEKNQHKFPDLVVIPDDQATTNTPDSKNKPKKERDDAYRDNLSPIPKFPIEMEDKMLPMKPLNKFNEVDKAIKFMFETGNKYAVEKNFDGIRGILTKIGIFNEQGADISKFFPTIQAEMLKLSNKDLILDAELMIKDGGTDEILDYINGRTQLDDAEVTANVVDIMHYNENIIEKPWYERKQLLHSLNFTPHIKEVSSLIVDDLSKAKKAITMMRNLKGSEGAVIKRYENSYSPGIYSDAMIRFRNEVVIELTESKVTNHDFFSKWSTPMAYFLGFLTADGHLDYEEDRIEMSTEDLELIKEFAKALGDDMTPEIYEGKYARYRVKSKKMAADLKGLGFSNLKQERTTYSKVPGDFKWDYARGVFDGDGSAAGNKMQYDTMNKGLSDWMFALWKTQAKEPKQYNYDKSYKVVADGEDANTIHNVMYAREPSIDRKKQAFSDNQIPAGTTQISNEGDGGMGGPTGAGSTSGPTTTSTPGIPSVQGKYIFPFKVKPKATRWVWANAANCDEVQLKNNYMDQSAVLEMIPSDELIHYWNEYSGLYFKWKNGWETATSIQDIITYGTLIYREIKNRGLPYKFNESGLYSAIVKDKVKVKNEDAPNEPYGDVSYADPGYRGEKKYPIDNEAHVRAAWSYINMPKNRGFYTADQLEHIEAKIKSAAKKYDIVIKNEQEIRKDVPEQEVFDFLKSLDHNPEDEEMHAWAAGKGYNIHEVEDVVYKFAWEKLTGKIGVEMGLIHHHRPDEKILIPAEIAKELPLA
jgi:hypothetical protein